MTLDSARAAAADPVHFRIGVSDVLGLWGAEAPRLLLPAWPASYPEKPCCFHVLPFREPWSDQVTRITEGACRGHATYVRGDRGGDPNVLRRIWSELSRSTHVVVDLTGFNANVALELGMAHTLGRNTWIVGQGDTVLRLFPSIAKLHVYRYSLEDGGRELRQLLRDSLH